MTTGTQWIEENRRIIADALANNDTRTAETIKHTNDELLDRAARGEVDLTGAVVACDRHGLVQQSSTHPASSWLPGGECRA